MIEFETMNDVVKSDPNIKPAKHPITASAHFFLLAIQHPTSEPTIAQEMRTIQPTHTGVVPFVMIDPKSMLVRYRPEKKTATDVIKAIIYSTNWLPKKAK